MTIPRLNELQGLAVARIAALPAISGHSVIANQGTQSSEIESALRNKGVCVVVAPVLLGRKRDQRGPRWILDVELMVSIKVNTAKAPSFDVFAAIVEIMNGLCADPRHPGGEYFQVADGEGFSLSQFDAGLLAYDLIFTKEVML